MDVQVTKAARVSDKKKDKKAGGAAARSPLNDPSSRQPVEDMRAPGRVEIGRERQLERLIARTVSRDANTLRTPDACRTSTTATVL
jgi:hypothetical protein